MNDYQIEQMNIQWYPGHMTKAMRMIEENIRNVDAVCEILDARIPYSSRNPDIDSLVSEKPRMVILNRTDLADPVITKLWSDYYKSKGIYVIETDAKTGKGVNTFVPAVKKVLHEKIEYNKQRGMEGKPLRVMILGIPNVGKSTFINKVAKRKAAIAGDKPGVTRGKQWINIDSNLDLLDTPGVLWPKFDSQTVGEMLAITNAIKADVLDKETLACNFLVRLRDMYPAAIEQRYKFAPSPEATGYELLQKAAQKRGFLISGGEFDTERMANVLLNEYHEGKLGRLSLEKPNE